MGEFEIKDSGARQEFAGGMVRDTTEGKTNFLNVLFGPMLNRWATHLTRGREKYPDPEPGVPNWTLAEGKDELLRAQDSAFRHMLQWLRGDTDEDHAAAVYFNVNLAEYVRAKMRVNEAGIVTAQDAEAIRTLYAGVKVEGHLIERTPKCGEVSGSAIPCNIGEGHVGPHSWQEFVV